MKKFLSHTRNNNLSRPTIKIKGGGGNLNIIGAGGRERKSEKNSPFHSTFDLELTSLSSI